MKRRGARSTGATGRLPERLRLQLVVGILDGDVFSVQLAFHDFKATEALALVGHDNASQAMFHHAKTFVCAVRRVARMCQYLLELELPDEAREGVKLAWRKKKTLLESYTKARDAIEHANVDEGQPRGSLVLHMNLVGDKLWVTGDSRHSATINAAAVASIVDMRDEIVRALGPATVRGAAQQRDGADGRRSG